MGKYYGVRKGRKPGVYDSWEKTQEQVKGFSGAEFKSFPTIEEANEYVHPSNQNTLQGVTETTDITGKKRKFVDVQSKYIAHLFLCQKFGDPAVFCDFPPNSIETDRKNMETILLSTGYNPVVVLPLIRQQTTRNQQPTRTKMTKKKFVAELVKIQREKACQRVIYITTHGGVIQKPKVFRDFELEEEKDYGQSLIFFEDIKRNRAIIKKDSYLTATELMDYVNNLDTEKMILILDCCCSGGVGSLKNMPKNFNDYDPNHFIPRGRGTFVLTACRKSEVALIDRNNGSLFTNFLCRAVGGRKDELLLDILKKVSQFHHEFQQERRVPHPNFVWKAGDIENCHIFCFGRPLHEFENPNKKQKILF
jgi:hypothetical protein